MKTRTILALTLVLSFVLGGVVMAAEDADPVSVDDTPMCRVALNQDPPNTWKDNGCLDTGDAFYECSQLVDDYDWAAKRIGPRSGDWVYMDHSDLIEVIHTTFNKPPTSFDWWVEYNPLGTVIVKSVGKGQAPGGLDDPGMYMIYTYDGEAEADSGLTGYVAQIGSNLRYYQIDHVTFCWNYVNGNGDLECYQEETAWAEGPSYIGANQWAMYVPYYGEELTVDIYAGQNMLAGTATFSAPVDGEVTITINLDNGFVFYYDPGDTEFDENLKVQDYEVAPEGNPAIGLFDWKESIEPGSTTAEITVPWNNYYGVHLDVAYPSECPVQD